MSNVNKNRDNQNNHNNHNTADPAKDVMTSILIPFGSLIQNDVGIKMEKRQSLTDLSISFVIDTLKGNPSLNYSNEEKDTYGQLDIKTSDQNFWWSSEEPSVTVEVREDGKKLSIALKIPIDTKVPGGTGEKVVGPEKEEESEYTVR